MSAFRDTNTYLNCVINLREMESLEDTTNLMMWMPGGPSIVCFIAGRIFKAGDLDEQEQV